MSVCVSVGVCLCAYGCTCVRMHVCLSACVWFIWNDGRVEGEIESVGVKACAGRKRVLRRLA